MNKIGKIGFIGGGKIAQAMAKGFIKAGELPTRNEYSMEHCCTTFCWIVNYIIYVEIEVDNKASASCNFVTASTYCNTCKILSFVKYVHPNTNFKRSKRKQFIDKSNTILLTMKSISLCFKKFCFGFVVYCFQTIR